MVKHKPFRTSLELEPDFQTPEEIRSQLLETVAKNLSSTLDSVQLVFTGLDGDDISPANVPKIKEGTIFARGIEDIAGDKHIDPLDYADEYIKPALVVYDRAKMHSKMDDGEYQDVPDDAVLGIVDLNYR